MKHSKRWTLALLPLLLAAACGGGGGGGSDDTDDPPTGNTPASLNNAVSSVPVVGEIVADCADTGVGVVDTIISTVNAVAGEQLPVAIPTLAQLLETADPSELPIVGGLVPDVGGGLVPISVDDLLGRLPGGVLLSGGLPVIGQLPTLCSTLVDVLPVGTLDDPLALLELLGDPTAALGLVPVLDGEGNPVALLLSTLPSGLLDGGAGIPILGGLDLPILSGLGASDPSSLPVLGGLVESLLGILDDGGLLAGLGGLGDLLDSLLGGLV